MALDCGATFVKYVLCLFNFIFFWAGAAVLGCGIWLAADQNSFLTLIRLTQSSDIQNLTQPGVIEQAAYLLIAAGAFVFIVSFLGYCGAVKESRVLLGLYGAFVLLIVALEITAGSLAAAYKSEAEKEIKGLLRYTLQQHYSTQQQANAVTAAWNLIQARFSCCGVNNYTDFAAASLWQGNKTIGQQLPESCCTLEGEIINFHPRDPDCIRQPSLQNSYFMTGCYTRLLEYFYTHLDIVLAVGVGLGVSQLLCVIFAFCLCRAIENDYIK